MRKPSLGKLGKVFHLAQPKHRDIVASQANKQEDSISSRKNPGELHRQAGPCDIGQPSQASAEEGFGLLYDDESEDDNETCHGDEDEAEPDPSLLGSVDYHNFLGGTSGRKAKFIWSPTTASRPSASNTKRGVDSDAICPSSGAPQTATKLQSGRQSPILDPTDQNL